MKPKIPFNIDWRDTGRFEFVMNFSSPTDAADIYIYSCKSLNGNLYIAILRDKYFLNVVRYKDYSKNLRLELVNFLTNNLTRIMMTKAIKFRGVIWD